MRIFTLSTLLASLTTMVVAVRELRIASPLTALTIWDNHQLMEEPPTFRSRFLPRFRAGLSAEAKAAKEAAEKYDTKKTKVSMDRADWAQQVAASDRRMQNAQAKAMERAYDEAVAKYDEIQSNEQNSNASGSSSSKYQFVGVVNAKEGETPITWYARRKPSTAKWSVRLVHVDRRAIIKDLFNRGKVDLFARYEITGRRSAESKQPMVEAKYTVRERSWKNIWNFSAKHFFTDSSGMYWRERRVRPGLYTDGSTVYESSYRYRDGRNGMHKVSSLASFLQRNRVKAQALADKLRNGTPDIVLED
ncbi:hypothetical protein MPSEU_000729600 [Mayamaea pseudoterrestris]|nr:hypothetical protein MPSEU_000729600 [Mayamaea pseudoterrestris]